MFYLKLHNLVRVFSLFCFISIAFEYREISVLGIVFLVAPYVIVFALATQKTYSTKIRVICRVAAAAIVSLLSVGLLFGIESAPQAPIGIGLVVVIQYGILFISEAIIGLVTYEESRT